MSWWRNRHLGATQNAEEVYIVTAIVTIQVSVYETMKNIGKDQFRDGFGDIFRETAFHLELVSSDAIDPSMSIFALYLSENTYTHYFHPHENFNVVVTH